MSFTVFCSALAQLAAAAERPAVDHPCYVSEHAGVQNDRDASKLSEYWELPYIQTLQLSISSLKDTVNLQCKFEARTNGDQDQVLFFFLFILKRYFQGCGSVMITFCV